MGRKVKRIVETALPFEIKADELEIFQDVNEHLAIMEAGIL